MNTTTTQPIGAQAKPAPHPCAGIKNCCGKCKRLRNYLEAQKAKA